MTQQNLFRLAAGIALLTASLLADNPAFTLIDYPGSTATQVWGISPRGVVVGFYAAAGVNHGFMLSGNQYTTIDYPGSALSLVNGIGSQGNIVGEYALTATGAHHGFLLSNGNFSTVDYPGATTTSAIGTNGAGDIVGDYSLADTVAHGFLLSGGKFSSIDFPNATGTAVNGMNDLGDVVGGYSLAGVSHGFVLSKSQFTTVDAPGAAFTTLTGINPRGDVVGRFRDSAGVNHGFLLSHGQFTTIDFPGASFTGATAISPAGDITGRCTVSGLTHGWLLKSSEGRYTITDLGPVGPSGQPFFLTDGGVVGGAAVMSDSAEHAVLWRKGQMTDLRTLGIGVSNSLLFAVNDNGQATGQSEIFSADPKHEDFCGFKAVGLPTWGQKCEPFLYQNGVMMALPTLGGNNGTGSGINAAGDVVGWAENSTADPGCPAPKTYQFKPVMWHQGQPQELPTVYADPEGVAILVNNSGQAVGGTGNCSSYNTQLEIPLQSLHAVLWQNGQATDLGNLGGTGHGLGILALGLNNKGQVVGVSDLQGDTASHAFLWNKSGGMQDLGALPGDVTSGGVSINDSGEVVGVSVDASGNPRAYHWQNGDMEDLNALVSGDSPLDLLLACSINSQGEIIGLAFNMENGDLHGYLATPSNGGAVTHSTAQTIPQAAREQLRKYVAGRPWGRLLSGR